MTKISLFIKPIIIKAYFSLFILIYIVLKPGYAQASFLGDLLTKVLGTETQASEQTPVTDNVVHNSQTVPLLESSINPDIKNIKDDAPVAPKTDNLLSNNGALGVDSDLEKYASSAKISTYVVKKGDTLESISKKLKIPKTTIVSSNSDLKKGDLLKVGQTLVILALKDVPAEKSVDKKDIKVSSDDKPVISDQSPKKVVEAPVVIEKPKDIEPTVPAVLNVPQLQAPIAPNTQTVDQPQTGTGDKTVDEGPSGQSGTINGGYIWPFPEGVGRVSQGLHADNAYDFAAPKGTPIYAIQDGTVLIAHPSGYNGGYGLYVVINFTDGRQAIFGHMSKVVAKAGMDVKKGDIIGYVGSTGKSTGPHCHIGFHGDLSNPYVGLKVNSTDIENND